MGVFRHAAGALSAIACLGAVPGHAVDEDGPYYLGNAVPRRNVPPPTTGCTAVGKVWAPISPDPSLPFVSRISWDWCQELCNKSTVTLASGMAAPCVHFAFFPDGKCYLQGPDAVLTDADRCNSTAPCDHDYQVVSGPADCGHESLWAVPPVTKEPVTKEVATTSAGLLLAKRPMSKLKHAGEGETCNGSLPPQFAILCADGLTCVTDGLNGSPGICRPEASTSQRAPSPMMIVDPPPENATIVGQYYVPHIMEGTSKTIAPSWRACMEICASNPSCKHFGYWPDGGCHQQAGDAKLTQAICDNSEPSCDGLQVISGPRDIGDKSLWPVLAQSMRAKSQEPQAQHDRGAVLASSGGTKMETTSESGGLPVVSILVGVLAAAVIAAGAGFYAWSRGLHDEDASDEEEGEDYDDGPSKPLRGA
eukprot:CAMPEP_0176025160 /NCGR_PEP_ID=MMETSP0120_2-20121206/12304_1 /TAXON_ID=160619 /ORGANISM="Kryptoperidinium foliaceum, Strain CCMP 1326" /LENGTH=420 /DNA_ID=CAMNT_0017358341 /DNA_START=27 /DNA_END=1286 /DNA_ORIENTATION=+